MDKMDWWRQARFGLFIHWGLYCVPAGKYAGREIPSIGEWIMKHAQIPLKEYAQYADVFNPVEFDADAWVCLARDAGMKYVVITAKHHDGFAMFDSACNDYNIVKRTPWGKDPMKQLAAACQKYGLKFCFYYSQAQDWADPDGIGNDWDFGPETEKNFDRYMNEKCLPQLTELLTQYGEIGLIWFDTPMTITRAQSETIANHVHALQPNCIVSGRIGHGVCDYRSAGDNMIPYLPVTYDWETPATLNDTWGFKESDHHWKTAAEVIFHLVDIVGKNGNYLLNVGPTAAGLIPAESVRILREVGAWLKDNGDSIYGTDPAPVPVYEQAEKFTHKPGKLFIHFFAQSDRNGKTGAYRLRNIDIDVHRCYFLAQPQVDVPFEVIDSKANGAHYINISLPEKLPSSMDAVLCLEYEGTLTRENI